MATVQQTDRKVRAASRRSSQLDRYQAAHDAGQPVQIGHNNFEGDSLQDKIDKAADELAALSRYT